MTQKQFVIVRLVAAALLSMIFSSALVMRNYWLFAVALVLGLVGLGYLKNQVKGVLVDERDYATAGTAARYAMTIYAVLMLSLAAPLMFWQGLSSQYGFVATAMCYSACLLMIIYSIVYRFLNRTEQTLVGHIWWWLTVATAVGMVLVFGLRFFSPEDSWSCQNGQWIQHGNPSAPQPVGGCEK